MWRERDSQEDERCHFRSEWAAANPIKFLIFFVLFFALATASAIPALLDRYNLITDPLASFKTLSCEIRSINFVATLNTPQGCFDRYSYTFVPSDLNATFTSRTETVERLPAGSCSDGMPSLNASNTTFQVGDIGLCYKLQDVDSIRLSTFDCPRTSGGRNGSKPKGPCYKLFPPSGDGGAVSFGVIIGVMAVSGCGCPYGLCALVSTIHKNMASQTLVYYRRDPV